jgi:lipopolysaccharide export LptBFGC system permease protein LptF
MAGQLVVPFIAWLLGLVVLMAGSFVFQAVKSMGGRMSDVTIILVMTAGKLPWGAVISVPIAFLFAASLMINRMSREGELTAFRVGGLSPRRLAVPVIGFGVVLSVAALAATEFLVPAAANWSLRRTGRSLATFTTTGQSYTPDRFYVGPRGQKLYGREQNASTGAMATLVLLDSDEQGRTTVATSPKGEWTSDTVRLSPVRLHVLDSDGRIVEQRSEPERVVELGTALDEIRQSQQPLEDVSIRDLVARQRALRALGQETRIIVHNMHLKPAVSMATFVFALVMIPLILRFTGSGFMGAMVAIVVLFVYYCLTAWGKVMAESGVVVPVLGTWATDLLFAAVGAVLLWRSG